MGMPTSKTKQSGFTLIELITVIVIIGIISVSAAPRFIDLRADAEVASLNGLKSALVSTNRILKGLAMIQGQDKLASGSVDIGGGTTVDTKFGYISFADNSTNADSLVDVINFDVCHFNRSHSLCAGGRVPDYIYDIDTVSGVLLVRFFLGDRIGTSLGPDNDQLECRLDYQVPETVNEVPKYTIYSDEC